MLFVDVSVQQWARDARGGKRKLTSSMYAKVARKTQLFGRLSHSAHALFHIEARMTRPTHYRNHSVQRCPAIQTDVANGIPEFSDGTREQRVSDDRLDRYDESTTEALVSRGHAEPLAK